MDLGDGSIKYILTGEGAGTTFTIDDSTGDIHAIQRLDREVKAQYMLRAQARNRLTDRPLEPESQFIVKIQDINDNEPRFLDGPYQATVPEMSKIGEPSESGEGRGEQRRSRWKDGQSGSEVGYHDCLCSLENRSIYLTRNTKVGIMFALLRHHYVLTILLQIVHRHHSIFIASRLKPI